MLAAAGLLVVVLAVYGRAGGYEFINFDDGYLFFDASRVGHGLRPDGIVWAFTTSHTGYWQPLTWLSHMIVVELFGPGPGWHHRVNVLLHLVNTEVLLLVLWRMTGGLWRSAFVAALFAAHPLHVESVAWVTERKDVLSTLFWMLSLGAYLRYARRPGPWRYLAVALLFPLGLMAKPMVVTLPCVLLLLDYWPLGRLGAPPGRPAPISGRVFARLLLEKAPLLALSAASSLVTYAGQSADGALVPLDTVALGSRLATALGSFAAYLGKTAWPAALALSSPGAADVGASVPAPAAALLLFGISALVLHLRFRRPALATGWLWYLGTLVPVIGLVQAGTTVVADRFTYVPLIGIAIAVSWLPAGGAAASRNGRLALAAAGIVTVVALGGAARVQAGYWRDSVTLAARALEVKAENWLASTILGLSLAQRGQFEQAIPRYLDALRLNPSHAQSWQNLGVAYASTGRLPQAITAYRSALALAPGYAEGWNNLCAAHAQLGEFAAAVACCSEALRLAPGHPAARHNLDLAREAQRRQPAASGASPGQ